VNSNPFYLLRSLPAAPLADSPDSTENLGGLLSALVRFHLRNLGGMPADLPNPNCMSPFPYMFGSTRVPGAERDSIAVAPRAGHVAVLRHGRFHSLPVLDEAGGCFGGAALSGALDELMALPPPPEPCPLALLTALPRGEVAAARARLLADPGNARALRAMDEALLVVALDDGPCGTLEDESRALLHGRGGLGYWDKHQLVRLPNGKLAVNFEHSYSDGMIWNRMLQEAAADVAGDGSSPYGPLPPAAAGGKPRASPLAVSAPFDEEAAAGVAAAVGDCDTAVLPFGHFGKGAIKAWGVSPDAAVQLSYQLAFARQHGGRLPAVYESCATRNFFRGRTEVIRSLTSESRK
jgi:hypothetical protein